MPSDPRPIYLDHHATTPLDPRVRDAMLPWLGARFGNPSSRSHVYGREAFAAVEAARAEVAALIGAKPREIIFTSGATEADELAIAGAVRGAPTGERHVVTQVTEHAAVLAVVSDVAREGVSSTVVGVDARGEVRLDALDAAITTATTLVSVMLSNSEIGTVQPLETIAAMTQARGVTLHSDAAQGLGYLALDVSRVPIDLVSLSSHKLYGPMGVGALFVRDRYDLHLVATQRGGGQERGLRGGTLNVPGIVGFGAACRIMREEGAAEAARLALLRDRLRDGLSVVSGVHVHGDFAARHPGNLSLRFDGVRADTLIVQTSRALAFSTGSACASGTDAPSHVLTAIGLGEDEARRAIRFGLGRFTTEDEITRTIALVVEAVSHIRDRAPGRGVTPA